MLLIHRKNKKVVILVKKIIKYLVTVTLIIIGIIVALFFLLVFLALIAPKDQKTKNGSVIIEYNGEGRLPNDKKPDPIYADTMEEALTVNDTYYFKSYPYMSKVNDVIKVFENDDYATMFYHSVKNKKKEGLVASKFKIRTINGKKQYALILVFPTEMGKKGERWGNRLKGLCDAAPLFDYLAIYGISDKDRFIFGSIDTEKVKTMKIEGQSPTEVIEYTLYGYKEYFWYYENLKSNKPSAEFDIKMEEE